MKLSGARIDGFIRQPDPTARAILLYGPNAGLVRERADALARHVVEQLDDPFRVTELEPAMLKEDPARLVDEAAALSFTGGRRVVRLRAAGDPETHVFKRFLDTPMGEALVVVEAGELRPRSRLRRLFEDADNAAALPCYADEGRDLERVVEEALAAGGFTIAPGARDYLGASLGNDRAATRAELDKLVTYMGDERHITEAHVEAAVGDSGQVTLDGVALAAAAGDLARLERDLARAYLDGAAPIAVLRAMARHLQRLHRVAGRVAGGQGADAAIKSIRPPVHFRVAEAMRRQIGRWPARRLATAMAITLEAEIECKTTGNPAEAVCSRALMRVARAAAR